MEKFWLVPFKEIYMFLRWWAWEIPGLIFNSIKNTLLDFDRILQFEANLRLWLSVEPLFGDYTWSGRLVGLLIRGARVLFTVVIYTGILLLGLILVFVWIILPFLIFVKKF